MVNPLPITGTVRGFPGSMSAADWAAYDAARGRVNAEHGVLSGLTVTPGVGTRELAVTGGEVVLPGLRILPSGSHAVGPATAASAKRMDLLVLEADWLASNQAGVVQFRIIPGTSPDSPPTPTLTAGVLWQMPVARAVLRSGASSYAAADVERVAPLPKWDRRYTADPEVRTVRGTGTWRQLGSVSVVDPGWAYRLDMRAQLRFEGTPGDAFGSIRAYDLTAGSSLAQGISGSLDGGAGLQAGRDTAQFSEMSGTLTGSRTITFDMAQNNAAETSALTVLAGSANYFTIIQRPSS